MTPDEPRPVARYVPGRGFYAAYALTTATLLAIGAYVSFTHEWNDEANAAVWLWLPGLLVLGVVGPLAVQYALLHRFGIRRPRRRRWGSGWNELVPHLVFWWEMGNVRLTKRQFALVHVVPALLVCAVMLAYVLRFPTAALILGIVLPIYLGNFWFALVAARKPEGTLVEVAGRGVRFHGTAT